MVALRGIGALVLLSLAGCGGGPSSPQLVDGSQATTVPTVLDGVDDAVLTRTTVVPARDIGHGELTACGVQPARDDAVVARVGLNGSSLTFRGTGSALYGCDKIPDPFTAVDPDRPWGGVWCGSPNGRLRDDRLNDPRLSLCPNTSDDIVAFAWAEPLPGTKWVVVSDAGSREVYEVAESLPVRVTTTDGARLGSSKASFAIEEYAADGSKLREYTLDTQVAG